MNFRAVGVEQQQGRSIRERVNGVEQIRIPKRRNWFVLLWQFLQICFFLPFGVFAASEVANGARDLWSILVLILCVAACLQSIAMTACQFAGAEIIRADRTGLETSVALGRLRWSRFFRAERIRHLTSSDPQAWDCSLPWPMTGAVPRPGAIKFDYGGRIIYAASLADETEGPLIVDWLRPKLPRSATEPS